MKKLVSILAVLFIAVSAMAQIASATGKVETIKSFRMGTCKLQKSTKDGAVTYQLVMLSSNVSSYELTIALGDAEKAAVTLSGLAEYKPSKGEIVKLNNPTDNDAFYNKFNAVWVIRSHHGQFHGNVSRGELNKMVEAINK